MLKNHSNRNSVRFGAERSAAASFGCKRTVAVRRILNLRIFRLCGSTASDWRGSIFTWPIFFLREKKKVPLSNAWRQKRRYPSIVTSCSSGWQSKWLATQALHLRIIGSVPALVREVRNYLWFVDDVTDELETAFRICGAFQKTSPFLPSLSLSFDLKIMPSRWYSLSFRDVLMNSPQPGWTGSSRAHVVVGRSAKRISRLLSIPQRMPEPPK